jgi:hypothetical protein
VNPSEDEDGWTSFVLATDPQSDVREAVHELAIRESWKVRELSSRTASLEDAFVDLLKEESPSESSSSLKTEN